MFFIILHRTKKYRHSINCKCHISEWIIKKKMCKEFWDYIKKLSLGNSVYKYLFVKTSTGDSCLVKVYTRSGVGNRKHQDSEISQN